MAYVNSGIAMKSTHYDWKVIIAIAIFFIAVTALVIMKVAYPDFEPGKWLSATPQFTSAHHAAITTAAPKPVSVVPANPSANGPIVTKSPTKLVVASIKAPPPVVIEPSVQPAEKTSKIVCSAEDREAQFCQ
jgi:hypothetical protein